jgi:hypothetical protein
MRDQFGVQPAAVASLFVSNVSAPCHSALLQPKGNVVRDLGGEDRAPVAASAGARERHDSASILG